MREVLATAPATIQGLLYSTGIQAHAVTGMAVPLEMSEIAGYDERSDNMHVETMGPPLK